MIRELMLSDVPELHAALERTAVCAFLGRQPLPSVAELRTQVAKQLAGPAGDDPDEVWCNWVVRFQGALIGRLQASGHGSWAEVAWVLDDRYWGRGFGFESASWLVDLLFNAPGCAELWASVDPANSASIRLLQRLGFVEQPAPPRRTPASFDDGDLVFAKFRPAGRG